MTEAALTADFRPPASATATSGRRERAGSGEIPRKPTATVTPPTHWGRRLGIALLALVSHGAVATLLLSLGEAPQQEAAPPVLEVAWIPLPATAQAVATRPPEPTRLPPPPRHVDHRQPAPPRAPEKPLLASSAPVPAPGAMETQEAIRAEPAPSHPASGMNSSPATAPPGPPATPVTAARFDADYLSNPAPEYPRLSRELREEGRVLLRVSVSGEGKPLDIQLQESSGFERLDRAAMAAVWKWRFVAARRGDEPLASWVLVPVNFTLRK